MELSQLSSIPEYEWCYSTKMPTTLHFNSKYTWYPLLKANVIYVYQILHISNQKVEGW